MFPFLPQTDMDLNNPQGVSSIAPPLYTSSAQHRVSSSRGISTMPSHCIQNLENCLFIFLWAFNGCLKQHIGSMFTPATVQTCFFETQRKHFPTPYNICCLQNITSDMCVCMWNAASWAFIFFATILQLSAQYSPSLAPRQPCKDWLSKSSTKTIACFLILVKASLAIYLINPLWIEV